MNYQLLMTNDGSLLAVRCSLFAVRCSLLAVHLVTFWSSGGTRNGHPFIHSRAGATIMRIKFTLEFYNAIDHYFPDDAFAEFMHRLLQFPAAGAVIKGLGGIRKIRAPDRAAGVGTRSGLRILYSYYPQQQLIVLYLAYRKRDQSDLLPHQRAYLLHLSLIDFEDEDVWYNPRNN